MSLSQLPDVALIKIFRTLDHVELVRLYHSFHSLKRIQYLIENCSSLWTYIHIKCTVDYHFFTTFSRLVISNAGTVRELLIDQLDLTCRKILSDNDFSLRKFAQLEQLIIDDQSISQTIQSVNFCSSTLKILRLTNEHNSSISFNHCQQLERLQLTFYSTDLLRNPLEQLTNLHLKLMFDHDHQSTNIFPRLPRRSLQIFTMKFLLLTNDGHFSDQFHRYLNSISHLHTLQLSYLHGMCPISLHINFNYSQYQKMLLVNICQLKVMKAFLELNQIDLPLEYLQYNSTLNLNPSSSHIQNQTWYRRQLISIDYLQCVTTSMELFNDLNIIWSDKNQITQSFESYILRSIYNVPHLISSIRNLSITKIELSLNGLITLMTRLPLVRDLTITDGRIDQMGSGMSDLQRILKTTTTTNIPQSDIQTMMINHIHMSRRTVVQLCLITPKLISLTMNHVEILDKGMEMKNSSSILLLLKQIAQLTDQFKWNDLKSLTLGKNLITRLNLHEFLPTDRIHTYAINLNELCLIISDHTLFEPHSFFLKSMKKLIKTFPKLTSFILELTKRYEGEFRLRNHLQTLFETNTNKKVYVYPTVHDRACRFCFDTNFLDEDDEDIPSSSSSSQSNRTFCGIPLFQFNKQRKSNILT